MAHRLTTVAVVLGALPCSSLPAGRGKALVAGGTELADQARRKTWWKQSTQLSSHKGAFRVLWHVAILEPHDEARR